MLYRLNSYLLFFLIGGKLFSQTIWTETFSNGCPSGCLANMYGGWTETATGTNDADANIWYVSGAECGNTPPACGSACGSTDPSLHMGSSTLGDLGAAYDAGGLCPFLWCVTTNKRMESPAINCTGYSNILVRLNFIHYGAPGNDEASFCYYNGSTWTTLGIFPVTNTSSCSGQGRWTQYIIALPASANNNPNVRIGFNWKNNDDGTGSDPSFAVDDIIVYAKQGFCYEQALVTYTNAGCTQSCVLTEFTGMGPYCNGTSSGCGSCPGTGPTMTLGFAIPAGCSASMTASFERRCNGIGCSNCSFTCNALTSGYGCCNSGMDNNDYVRIRGDQPPTVINGLDLSPGYIAGCSSNPSTTITIAGSTITATGNNNGGAQLFYSQTGGNIILETRANRLDEIVTYTLAITPTCNCSDIVLPIDLVGFWAEYSQGKKRLSWMVKEEKNVMEYRIFVSSDGKNFEPIGTVNAIGIHRNSHVYELEDLSSRYGFLYYKLEVINQDRSIEKTLLQTIQIFNWVSPFHWSKDENGNVIIESHENVFPAFLDISTTDGKILYSCEINSDEPILISSRYFVTNSLYLIRWKSAEGIKSQKIIY